MVLCGFERPVRNLLYTGAIHAQVAAGRDFVQALPDTLPGRSRPGEEFPETLQIHGSAHPGIGEYCLRLRAKEKCASIRAVVQWLDPEPVPDKQQSLHPLIPDCKCVHAIELVHQLVRPLQIAREDNLGVTLGTEYVPAIPEFLA